MVHTFYMRDFFQAKEQLSAGYYLEHREINMHNHEFWEISYVIEGIGTHYFENGTSDKIKKGDFLLISPGPAHCIVSPPPEKGSGVRVCNILISPDYMKQIKEQFFKLHEFDENPLKQLFLTEVPICLQLVDDSESIYRMITNITHEYNHFSEGSGTIMENEMLNLLVYISRLYQKTVNNNYTANTKKEPIDDLLKFIGSNFSSPLTLDYLAEYVHFTPEYLSRYFKKYTGKNLSVYIAETRIEKAKYMLRTTNHAIIEIAEYCGYSTRNNFEKSFKKYAGMTASAYRNLHMPNHNY